MGEEAVTVVGFDFGLRRIGVAVGDTLTKTAGPRLAVRNTAAGPDWGAIEREIAALQPAMLVVGAPYNADGGLGTIAAAARAFATELERRFRIPVQHVDERFSSLEAGDALRAQRASGARRRRVRRDDVDSAAAAVILGRWLAGESAHR